MKNSTAIFLIILSFGLFYTFTRPYYQSTRELVATAEGYEEVLDNIANIIEERDRLLINYNSLPKAEIDRVSKVLPANVDTVRMALDLDNIASRYGIAIKDVAIDTSAERNTNEIVLPEGQKPYEKTLVSVSFISNYQNFRKFLEDLEKSLRIMDVKSIRFQSGSESGLYEHKLLLETYWIQ